MCNETITNEEINMTIEKSQKARKEVEEMSRYLEDSVREVTSEMTAPIDSIIDELSKGINLYSTSELWDFQVRLSIAAYDLGNRREQSALREACADALAKEGIALSFVKTQGAQETKKQQSIIDNTDKTAVHILYDSVYNLLKTKCDEAHRVVNVLQGIQISRAAEAKQVANPRSEADKLLLEQLNT